MCPPGRDRVNWSTENWGGFSPPVFGRTVNPISTRGADYADHSTKSPPDFQTLRRPWKVMIFLQDHKQGFILLRLGLHRAIGKWKLRKFLHIVHLFWDKISDGSCAPSSKKLDEGRTKLKIKSDFNNCKPRFYRLYFIKHWTLNRLEICIIT